MRKDGRDNAMRCLGTSFWIAACIAVAPVGLWAQEPVALPAPLSLEECVRAALSENPAALSAELSAEGAAHAAEAAKAPYYPSLAFNLGGSRWQRRIFLPNGLSFPGQPVPTIVGPTDDWSLSLNAAYTLFDGGERKAHLGAARARQKAGEADAARSRQDVALSVLSAYFSLASAQAQREVAQASLKRSQDHLRLAQARKEAGTVPLLDVKRAESEVAEGRLVVVRADNAVRLGEGRLATAMGIPAGTPLAIAAVADVPTPPQETEMEEARQKALLARPVLQATASGVEAAKGGVQAARSAFSPKVSAAAAYGREDAAWYPQDKTWFVGVTVSVPIFTGFSRMENLAKAKVDLSRAEADARFAALAVQEQVWDAFSAVRAAYESIQAAQALAASATESERLARERYAAGAGILSDLLDAQTALARAEASLVAAEWDYRAARAQFRWSAGDLAF
jgi:outer membrane protein